MHHRSSPAFICDGTGVVRAWNRAISSLTGWAPSAVLDKRLVDVMVPPELRQMMQARLLRSTSAATALRVQTSDGRLVEIHLRVTNLTDGAALEGSGDARLAVGIDVTALLGKAAARPPPTLSGL